MEEDQLRGKGKRHKKASVPHQEEEREQRRSMEVNQQCMAPRAVESEKGRKWDELKVSEMGT